MKKASLKFHIEKNDFFGTAATILDLVSQDLRKKGHRSNAETLRLAGCGKTQFQISQEKGVG